jgi:hypothetical protein
MIDSRISRSKAGNLVMSNLVDEKFYAGPLGLI